MSAHALCVAASSTGPIAGPWPTYNNGYDGQRFSSASQITTANVATLKRACEAHLGDVGAFHSGPIVIEDTLYVTTAHGTVALDAKTGRERWRFYTIPRGNQPSSAPICNDCWTFSRRPDASRWVEGRS